MPDRLDLTQLRPILCRRLRAKNSYGGNEGGEDGWQLIDTATMIFRCSATLQSWGPDGQLATYTRCQPGRNCYEQPPPSQR